MPPFKNFKTAHTSNLGNFPEFLLYEEFPNSKTVAHFVFIVWTINPHSRKIDQKLATTFVSYVFSYEGHKRIRGNVHRTFSHRNTSTASKFYLAALCYQRALAQKSSKCQQHFWLRVGANVSNIDNQTLGTCWPHIDNIVGQMLATMLDTSQRQCWLLVGYLSPPVSGRCWQQCCLHVGDIVGHMSATLLITCRRHC